MQRSAQYLLILSLLVGCARHASPPTMAPTAPTGGRVLTARDVDEQPVLGSLGIALGTITEIRAVVVIVGDPNKDSDRYRLRVTQVGGRDRRQSAIRADSLSRRSKQRRNRRVFERQLAGGSGGVRADAASISPN